MNKRTDRMMAALIKRYGFWAAIRFCKNLGISFEEVYYLIFGRLPKV